MMLKQIYTFFIGVLVATFIGVGISAFYESPKMPEFPLEETMPYKEFEPVPATPSTEEMKLMREQNIKQDQTYRDFSKLSKTYSRNVSIIASISAVLLVIIGLTLLKKLDLLSDGLLLGGLFTQLYSIVRGFESEDSKFRFLVVAIGLAASLLVGYFKFIRQKEAEKI